MAKISVGCPQCRSNYRVEESHVGKKARCKKCDTTFQISGHKNEASPASSRQDPDSGHEAAGVGTQAAEKASAEVASASARGKGCLSEIFDLSTHLTQAAAALSAPGMDQLRAQLLGMIEQTATTLGINVPPPLTQLTLDAFCSSKDILPLREALRIKFGDKAAAMFESGIWINLLGFADPQAAEAVLNKAIELCESVDDELSGLLYTLLQPRVMYSSGYLDKSGFQKEANQLLGLISMELRTLDENP